MPHPLENAIWNSLSGPQIHLTVGETDIRRYAQGYSPIIGFADPKNPNFAGSRQHCEIGEGLYCDGWSGDPHTGWEIIRETSMYRMVYNGPIPINDSATDAVALGPEHSEAALELAVLTNPGPFGPRTIELGEYFGYFDGGRLIAMAGERFHVGEYREISGVCTHPDHQGRGLARSLMNKLIYRQMQREQAPFLHVISSNKVAHNLYLRIGFVDYLETIVRVVARTE